MMTLMTNPFPQHSHTLLLPLFFRLVICVLTHPLSLQATYTSCLLHFSHCPDHIITVVVQLFPMLQILSHALYSIYTVDS